MATATSTAATLAYTPTLPPGGVSAPMAEIKLTWRDGREAFHPSSSPLPGKGQVNCPPGQPCPEPHQREGSTHQEWTPLVQSVEGMEQHPATSEDTTRPISRRDGAAPSYVRGQGG